MLAFLKKFNYPITIGISALNDISIASIAIGAAIVPSTSTHSIIKNLQRNFLDRLDNYMLQVVDYYTFDNGICIRCKTKLFVNKVK